MNEIPFINIFIMALFSGFVLYAVIQFTYIYLKMPMDSTLRPLIFSCSALLYILSDTVSLLFSFIYPSLERARFFFIVKELTPLLFSIFLPYFLQQLPTVSAKIQRINRVLLWTGAAATAAITSLIALLHREIIISINNQPPVSSIALTSANGVIDLLFIIRDIIIALYLFYTIFLLLYRGIRTGMYQQNKKIIIGLAIMGYFMLVYLYMHIFSVSTGRGGLYPLFSLGLIILMIFMTLELVDILSRYRSKLVNFRDEYARNEYYDPTLGIPNRTSFTRDLQSGIDYVKRRDETLFIIILDLDNFQSVAEFYGDAVGNEIMKMLSLRLIELFDVSGALYRLGIDDFGIILRDIKTLAEAETMARKIITSFRNPFSISGSSYLVTASLGILRLPQDGDEPGTIFKNANAAIRAAKKSKNTYEVFSQGIVEKSVNKIHIMNLLRESISQDQFIMFYQPIVNAREELVHAEALLRSTDSTSAIGGPGFFIPLIEKAGLSREVDNMVIRKTFHDMEMHIRKKFNISINLSTEQLVNPRYSEFLVPFAAQHDINTGQIILEVTEDKLMENLVLGRESLIMLKNSGFTIAIDDFGKGFSSLAYLAELPVDIIKLDMAFVQSVPGSGKKESMVRHILELAHSLGLQVIAEGFERREQFDFFRKLGCDLYQGYLFSRPVPLIDVLSRYSSR